MTTSTFNPTDLPLDGSVVLCGRYKVVGVCGNGGGGVVYKCQDQLLGESLVAVKIFPGHTRFREIAKVRAAREIKFSHMVNHDYIVKFYSGLIEKNFVGFAMEFVDGMSLSERVKSSPPLTLQQKIIIMERCSRALEAIHKVQIVHRDIKPANILVTADCVPKIADFGIAKSPDVNLAEVTTKTISDVKTRTGKRKRADTSHGDMVGTIGYLSPEYIEKGTIDCRADLYAFGVTSYFLLTGRMPFKGKNSYELIQQQVNSDPTPPHRLVDCPETLSMVIMRLMERNPDQRYSSAEELSVDMKALLAASVAKTPLGKIDTPGSLKSQQKESGFLSALKGVFEMKVHRLKAGEGFAIIIVSIALLILGITNWSEIRTLLVFDNEAPVKVEALAYQESDQKKDEFQVPSQYLFPATDGFMTLLLQDESFSPEAYTELIKSLVQKGQSIARTQGPEALLRFLEDSFESFRHQTRLTEAEKLQRIDIVNTNGFFPDVWGVRRIKGDRERHTSVKRFPSYRARVRDYLEKTGELTEPKVYLSVRPLYLGTEKVLLTETKYDANTNDLLWIHPSPNDAETLIRYSVVKAEKLISNIQNIEKKKEALSEIHFFLLHAHPYYSGNAAIIDTFVRILGANLGMTIGSYRQGVTIEAEAYVSTLREFSQNYESFFK